MPARLSDATVRLELPLPLRTHLSRWSDRLLIDAWPGLGARLFDMVGANAEPEMALLPRLVRRDALAIDVGAKVGAYTRRLLPLAAGVHAFEPNPRLARFLARSLPAGARVHALALGDATGRAVLRVPRDADGRPHPGRATIAPGNDFAALPGASATAMPVPVARLDDLDGLGPVGFIKIDVEGHERAVIAGGAGLLARDRPRLLVEANAAHGGAPDLLLRDLAALEYRPFVLAGGQLRPLEGPAPGENLVFLPVGDRV